MAASIAVTKIWNTPHSVGYLATYTNGGGGNAAHDLVCGSAVANQDPALDTVGYEPLHTLLAAGYADKAHVEAAFGSNAATAPNPVLDYSITPIDSLGSADWKVAPDIVGGAGTLAKLTLANFGIAADSHAVLVIRHPHSIGKHSGGAA